MNLLLQAENKKGSRGRIAPDVVEYSRSWTKREMALPILKAERWSKAISNSHANYHKSLCSGHSSRGHELRWFPRPPLRRMPPSVVRVSVSTCQSIPGQTMLTSTPPVHQLARVCSKPCEHYTATPM